MEQSEYIGFLEFSAGLKIRIHDPDELPLVSGLGFAVMPGSHVYASITRQRVSRQAEQQIMLLLFINSLLFPLKLLI